MGETLTELRTEAFTAEREWMSEGLPVLSATVSLPRPTETGGAVSRRIRRYYQTQCRAYLRYCEHWLLPLAAEETRSALESSAPLPRCTAALTYQVTYNSGGLWSLYTQSRESGFSGPGTPLTRRGDTWDLRSGYPVPLSSFFPGQLLWRRDILEAVAEEIRRQERAGISRYHDGWRKELRRRFNPQNFYLTASGPVVFYQMHAIAPAAEGVPVFPLPRESGERI